MGRARKLTDKQQIFVDEYLVDLNATQAAIRSGYSKKTAQEQSARLLSNVMVSAAIEKARKERQERTHVEQDDVIKGAMELLDKSLGRVPVERTAIVDGVPLPYEGKDFSPSGAGKALELLGKHLGMFVDKSETKVELIDNPAQAIFDAHKSRTAKDD